SFPWVRSLDEASQLLPEPLEHTALGEEHGIRREDQLLGDMRRRLAFQDVSAERLPGRRRDHCSAVIATQNGTVVVAFGERAKSILTTFRVGSGFSHVAMYRRMPFPCRATLALVPVQATRARFGRGAPSMYHQSAMSSP